MLERDFQDQELTKSYRLETATMLTQVNELTDTAHPQVFSVTRCSSCHGQLDLPSSHFMCKDSYHQRYVENLFYLEGVYSHLALQMHCRS